MMSFLKNKEHSFVCPKTGRIIKTNIKQWWYKWLFPITGLAALIWFLIRVIPKPSRAMYPCQRFAAPIASGFIIWLLGLSASIVAFHKARHYAGKLKYAAAAVCIIVAVVAIYWPLGITGRSASAEPWVPTDGVNSPMGTAKGIRPGRVVWVYDANAALWDGVTGYWWQSTNTNQTAVSTMMSKAIRNVAGTADDAQAWDLIFKYFNNTHTGQNIGYQAGEKIAIKVNINNCGDHSGAQGGDNNSAAVSPQAIYALCWQLINRAGVPANKITVYDASRFVPNNIYNYCVSLGILFADQSGGDGRIAVVKDTANPIHFSNDPCTDPLKLNMNNPWIYNGPYYPPTCVTEAKYIINLAHLKGHDYAGVTLCAKNHFGSLWNPDTTDWNGQWSPGFPGMHTFIRPFPTTAFPTSIYPVRAMGTYNSMVDLMGYKHLGGKTLLYMMDALYIAPSQSGALTKWQSFGNKWTSSVFASQDGVAIDSVGIDFLASEPTQINVYGTIDNYLHEASQAGDPPSGTFYDPEGDGTRLQSLGVHEHWNNSERKQYSRNLGTGNGIELVAISPFIYHPKADLNGDVKVDFKDYSTLTAHWNEDNSYTDANVLIGWWKFDETSGAIALDSAGTHNGTIVSATRVTGKYGKALNFAGVGYVSVPPAVLAPIDKEVTIAFWQYGNASQPQTNSTSFSYGVGGGIIWTTLSWSPAGTAFWMAGTGWSNQISKANTDPDTYKGRWNHWAFTKNGNTGDMKIFVNANLWHSGTGFTEAINGAVAQYLYLGSYVGSYYYDGSLDDFRLYRCALTASEVAQVYNGTEIRRVICSDPQAADLNSDCVVDEIDLAILADDWLTGMIQ